MRQRTIGLETPDGAMPLYEAVPENPRGAVIVFQEAYGVNAYIEDVCGRLAGEGYHAVAPHLFHRTGGGVVSYGDMGKAIEMIGTLSDDGMLADADAAIAHLGAAGFAMPRIGTVGFCMGGRTTFLVCARRAIGAGVGFYGGGIVTSHFPQLPSLAGEAPTMKAPWLGLFGDKDPSIPVADVERLRDVLHDSPFDAEVVRYPDAGHGFHSDQRDSYVPEAAADGWQRCLAWFARHLR